MGKLADEHKSAIISRPNFFTDERHHEVKILMSFYGLSPLKHTVAENIFYEHLKTKQDAVSEFAKTGYDIRFNATSISHKTWSFAAITGNLAMFSRAKLISDRQMSYGTLESNQKPKHV